MAIIGIDLGSENCYVASICSGGIEVLVNDTGHRSTPAYVGFGERNRTFGVTAKSQHVMNVKNTIFGCKRLIGRKACDQFVSNEMSYLPYHLEELTNGFYGVKVSYRHREVIFSVQQIVGMVLASLKEIAQAALQSEVQNCVLAVPSYFPDSARRAILDAGRIAGLNILRLLNDTTAVALSYGFYKENLSESKPTIVIFADMGHTAFQVSACAITKGKLTVLATVTESELGGRDFDSVIVRHFATEFREKYKLNVFSSTRATIRLLNECEKLKKQLSANPQALPLNIECFMEDKDVSGSLGRDKFEEMCDDLLKKAEFTMQKLLSIANLKSSDIDVVELVGGSCRIPAVKQLIQNVFGTEPSTTLNLDEAVARGCALHCAMLSPNLKVREYLVSDVQPFPIKLLWTFAKGGKGEVEVFSKNYQIPFSKYWTFYQSEPLTLDAYYGTVKDKPCKEDFIGSFTINNIGSSSNETPKLCVKIRINIHGIFSVCSAVVIAKDDDSAMLAIDQKAEDEMDITGKPKEVPPKTQENEKTTGFFLKKQKKITKPVDLPITAKVPQLMHEELSKLIEHEIEMQKVDDYEKERVDTKNCLEEYVYEMRNALANELAEFVNPEDHQKFTNKLKDVETWLYESGELQKKEVFTITLQELKGIMQPLLRRRHQYQEREVAIFAFRNAINQYERMWSEEDPRPIADRSVSAEEVEKIRRIVKAKSEWFEKQLDLLSRCERHQDPPVGAEQITSQKMEMLSEIKKIQSA